VTDVLNRRSARLISRADSDVSQINDRYLMRMLGDILRPYRLSLLAVFVMLLGVTVLSLLPPWLTQQAVDGPITQGNLDGLIPFGIAYFAAIISVFVLRFAYTYLLQTVGQNALANLRQKLFDHLMRQDMRFFNTTPVGQIVSRLSNDIEALTELLSTSIVMVASNMLTLAGIVVVMFVLNWRLAVFALGVLPVMIACTVYWRRHIRRASNQLHKLVAEYLAFLNEQFGGMLIVQLFNRQAQSRAEFSEINGAYRTVHGRLRDSYTLYWSTLQLLTSVGFALALYGGGQGVLAGWATLGTLIAFVEYTRRTYDPILQLAEQFAQIQTALSAGERVARLLNVEPEILEPEHPVRLTTTHHCFAFEKVSFAYDEGAPVLRDVDFEVQPGQRVAIVGASGAGKTSLAGLLGRYYDVTSGRVTIDGVDVRDLSLADLRGCVTVVPQSPYCFNGTIADNLRLFDPDVTFDQMQRAARISCAAEFIERLPGGYDFELLPGGANVSQGQRQLIALARALIHHPNSILVLDEATSSIDTETELLIQKALAQVLEGRTSLVIAHRLSTVREADLILVMKRGRVVERGTHHTLLAAGGEYAGLYARQFEEGE
jgi:ATP-binding cassette, subfamily B, multidrug efflux pump